MVLPFGTLACLAIYTYHFLCLVQPNKLSTSHTKPPLQQKMASNAWLLALAVVLATLLLSTHAADPDITSDFVVPDGVTPDANFFTFKGLKQALRGAAKDAPFKVTKASQLEFPALVGQSVSYAVLQFAPGGINTPHTHPRSAELLFVLQGSLEVGLVDSNNTLFTQLLRTGELFVFPKGLVHFQANKDAMYPAVALSAFGSANAGTVPLPKTLFGSGIDAEVLAKSFKTDAQTIAKLVSAATMG